jgi:putative transcriptional regulator
MIRCRLAHLMAKKNMKISDVARQTGLNRSTVAALYHERASRVELDAINRLCGFFGCAVGDLFDHEQDRSA